MTFSPTTTGKKRVIALFSHGARKIGGCEVYRVLAPLSTLGQRTGWQTNWTTMDMSHTVSDLDSYNIYMFPRLSQSPEQRRITLENPVTKQLIAQGEISAEAQYPLFDYLRRLPGKRRLVYEIDDDFTNEHRVFPGGGDAAMDIARECDAITVSTPYLAKVMQRVTKKPVYVLPNCVEPSMWRVPSVERVTDKLTIALTGSATHIADWAVLAGVMPEILARYPETVFILGGLLPDYFDDLPLERVLRVEGLPYNAYTGLVRAADIVLAPLDPEDPFNWSKSSIKVLEGMAAHRKVDGRDGGAVVMASDAIPYRKVIQHGDNGLLVEHTPDAWLAALQRVLDDALLRKQLAIQGHRWVLRHRNIKTSWKLWANAYTSILTEDRKEHDSNRTTRLVDLRAAVGEGHRSNRPLPA